MKCQTHVQLCLKCWDVNSVINVYRYHDLVTRFLFSDYDPEGIVNLLINETT